VKIVQIPNGAFVQNSYLVIDEAAAECAVIDPGEEAGRILHEITGAGARPTAIWITHAHLDHVMGVARVRRETGTPVYLHPADRELYDQAVQQGLAFGVAVDPPPAPSGAAMLSSRAPTASAERPACLRCGAEVRPKPWGCKNPCPNCGYVYPLGDCSD